MEERFEALRVWKSYGRGWSWEIICRCLIVIAGVMALGVSAGYGGEGYWAADEAAGYVWSDGCIEKFLGKTEDVGTAFGGAGIGAIPVGKMDMSGIIFPKDVSDMVRGVKVRKIPETVNDSKVIVPAAPYVRAKENAVERDGEIKADGGAETFSRLGAENGMTDNAGGIALDRVSENGMTDNAGGIALDRVAENAGVIDKAAGDKAEEETPSVMLTVSAYGNGGVPEAAEVSVDPAAFTLETLETPTRLGKLFDGWYVDDECSIPFTGIEEGCRSLNLYAGWKEFPGFKSNDLGHIVGCTGSIEAVFDGFLCIPGYENCVGIEKGAFDGMEEDVFELYIPANITYIEEGAFDNLTNLMFIEASGDNPVFYSEKGVLYYNDGTVAAYPEGLRLLQLGTGYF